jgi:hypothetical protein
MKTRRILQLTILALATAFLAAPLLTTAPAANNTQPLSFAAYHRNLTLLENQRALLADRLRAQARFLNETEGQILADLDAREVLLAARLECLTDQLTKAEARTIKLRSQLQAIKQTRDADDNYGVGMRLWNNAVQAAVNAEKALREKLDEEKAAASKLYRKRTAIRLINDEFDSTKQLYAAVCRRIQNLQRRLDAPPSS